MNCSVRPFAMDGFAGVTAMDCRIAAVTVSEVEPEIEFRVALMVLLPVLFAVAKPPVAMVATPVVADAQVTKPVRFWVLLSLYVPVAVNCSVRPLAIEGFAGVTAMDCRVAAVTVSKVEPEIEFRVAPMVLLPVLLAVARPPAAMVATPVVADAHVTEAVRFCVLLSL